MQALVAQVENELSDIENPLVLWTGYFEGMLQLAATFMSRKKKGCTIESSTLSSTFVKTCGSWDEQLKCIRDRLEKAGVEKNKIDKLAEQYRKQLWDDISRTWAHQKVQHCIAFLPPKPDFKKTLFMIELLCLQPDVRVTFVHMQHEIEELTQDKTFFNLYRSVEKTKIPALLEHIKLFDEAILKSLDFQVWKTMMETNNSKCGVLKSRL